MICFPAAAQDSGKGSDAPAASAPGERKGTEEIGAIRNELKERPTAAGFVRLGELLLKENSLKEAGEAFDEALRMNPRSLEARIGKGTVLVRQGDLAQAEQVLREALPLNPNPLRVHYELGLLYEKQGDFARAVAEYKEGLKKHQEHGL